MQIFVLDEKDAQVLIDLVGADHELHPKLTAQLNPTDEPAPLIAQAVLDAQAASHTEPWEDTPKPHVAQAVLDAQAASNTPSPD